MHFTKVYSRNIISGLWKKYSTQKYRN
ncbi:MAG TPA: hypothetical protein DIV38_04760 [Clostridiales bacterium]|nr:hypothetical protein [Clostridiales bacterium]